MTYVWVALGGALGSVARAWLSGVVLRATASPFPWGTIGINVVGSFVIAFFGVLTAANARQPLWAEARAFVMVGVCGGFTTFSSFSLQTLDLAREGRPAQALANIALSLALCLAAVTAGYYAAAALTGGAIPVSDARLSVANNSPDQQVSVLGKPAIDGTEASVDAAGPSDAIRPPRVNTAKSTGR